MILQLLTKAYIENQPFEREGLFSTTTDTVLQKFDKSIKTSRNLEPPPAIPQEAALGPLPSILLTDAPLTDLDFLDH